MNRMRIFFGVLMLLVSLLVSGCDPQGEKENQNQQSVSSSVPSASSADAGSNVQKKKEYTFKVYYPNSDGTKLVAVKRSAEAEKGGEYASAVNSLLEGTDDKALVTIFPKTARLLGIEVANGIAKVNFNSSLKKDFVGGSTGETLLIASLVNTLTEFPEIKSVQILIDGKTLETLAGHMDLSGPVKRMDNLIQK